MASRVLAFGTILALSLIMTPDALRAQDAPADGETNAKDPAVPGLVPLNKDKTVLIDAKGKRILLKTKVVLRDGLLEMLVCRKQTKEHEAILAVDSPAYVIHTGLVALGAQPGAPVSFHPKYTPPTGQKIDIHVQWTDEDGKLQRVPARSWVRHAIHRYYGEELKTYPADLKIPKESDLRWDDKHKELSWYGPMTKEQRDELLALSKDAAYRKAIESFYKRGQSRPLDADWVFAGSGFYVDQQTGKQAYRAEGGDVICVANFPTAMIDVAMESTAQGEANLLFEAWTERIPPIGTEVTVELAPVFEKKPVEKKPVEKKPVEKK